MIRTFVTMMCAGPVMEFLPLKRQAPLPPPKPGKARSTLPPPAVHILSVSEAAATAAAAESDSAETAVAEFPEEMPEG